MALGDAAAVQAADSQRRLVAIGHPEANRLDLSDAPLRRGLYGTLLATQADLDAGRDVTWVTSYPGRRPYIDYEAMAAAARARGWNGVGRPLKALGRYLYNLDYRAFPAPVRLDPDEVAQAHSLRCAMGAFVLMEPALKADAPPAKQWPRERYAALARRLIASGVTVRQMSAPGAQPLADVPVLHAPSFRAALVRLKAADVYVGPEGGLHHGAAAMGTRAVVLYGGFTSPAMTGYPDLHVNLTGAPDAVACGTRYGECPHCTALMAMISVDEVEAHVRRLLTKSRRS